MKRFRRAVSLLWLQPNPPACIWRRRLQMDRFFSDIGIRAVDFVYISVVFILTMAVFFGVPKKQIVSFGGPV